MVKCHTAIGSCSFMAFLPRQEAMLPNNLVNSTLRFVRCSKSARIFGNHTLGCDLSNRNLNSPQCALCNQDIFIVLCKVNPLSISIIVACRDNCIFICHAAIAAFLTVAEKCVADEFGHGSVGLCGDRSAPRVHTLAHRDPCRGHPDPLSANRDTVNLCNGKVTVGHPMV